MKKKTGLKRVISLITIQCLVIVGVCLLLVKIFDNLKFGLDLQGGFEVLYKVESVDGSKMTSEKMTATYKTLSKRIDSLGVSEPEIIIEGNDKIRVKLAGVKNPDDAREILGKAANLTFTLEKKHQAYVATYMYNGEKHLLVKPTTYMNLSGDSVSELVKFYKIDVKDMILADKDQSLKDIMEKS